MALADQIISAESSGNPNATNPRSSAMGQGQFLSSTWLNLINKYRPDLAQGKSQSQILAMRADPNLSNQMVRAYANENTNILGAAGFPATAGNIYLAHFAGPGGAVSVLKADPSTPVSQILTPDAVAANPFLKNMNAGQLEQWAAGHVGGAQNSVQTADASAPTLTAPQPSNAGSQMNGLLGSGSGLLGLLNQSALPQTAQAGTTPQVAGGGLLGNGSGLLGLLNGSVAPSAGATPQQGTGGAGTFPQSPAAPSPLQLSQGTPAAQMMKARLLAAIMGNGAQAS